MSADLDWTRLETLVGRAADRLRQTAADNERLRAEVARLEAELESARSGFGDAAPTTRAEGSDVRTEEVRRRLAHLEDEIESLLSGSAG